MQRARLLALLALLALGLSLCQAKEEDTAKDDKGKEEVSVPKGAAPSNATAKSSSMSAPGASPPLLSAALGGLAALLLHLR